MNRLAASSDGNYDLLGGQHPFEVFNRVGQKLDLGVVSPYTDDLSGTFETAMFGYIEEGDTFNGCLNDSYDVAEARYGLKPAE
jgi:hypothetical protein